VKLTATIEGKEELLASLKAMQVRAEKKLDLFADAGHYMTFTAVPMNFRQHGPGWPSVRRGGSPLIDTGRLRNSISYTANSRDVVIGSRLAQAGIHNRGGEVRPRAGKFLAIPLVPPLTLTEARTKGPRDFHSTFVRAAKGIAGGKLIVFQRMWKTASKASSMKGIRAIFLLLKVTRIKRRPYLVWKPDNLRTIGRRWATYIGRGKEAVVPASGGSTDMGGKRGRG